MKPVQQQPRQRHLITRACTSNLQVSRTSWSAAIIKDSSRPSPFHAILTLPLPRPYISAHARTLPRTSTHASMRTHALSPEAVARASKCALWAVHASVHGGLRSQWVGLLNTCRDRDGAAPCVRATHAALPQIRTVLAVVIANGRHHACWRYVCPQKHREFNPTCDYDAALLRVVRLRMRARPVRELSCATLGRTGNTARADWRGNQRGWGEQGDIAKAILVGEH